MEGNKVGGGVLQGGGGAHIKIAHIKIGPAHLNGCPTKTMKTQFCGGKKSSGRKSAVELGGDYKGRPGAEGKAAP